MQHAFAAGAMGALRKTSASNSKARAGNGRRMDGLRPFDSAIS